MEGGLGHLLLAFFMLKNTTLDLLEGNLTNNFFVRLPSKPLSDTTSEPDFF